MKKFLLLPLVLTVLLFVAGCGTSDNDKLDELSKSLDELRDDLADANNTIDRMQDLLDNLTTADIDTVQLSNVVNKVYSSVVGVKSLVNDQGVSTGSGVIYKKVDDTYYVVTNHHVIEDGDSVAIHFSYTDYIDGTVLASDETVDLAIVTFTSTRDFYVSNITTSENLVRGQYVFAMGSPLGFNHFNTVTFGNISNPLTYVATNYVDNVAEDYYHFLLTDAALNSGNSGGPLFNLNGDVIGINTLKLVYNSSGDPTDEMGFSIPSDTVIKVINELENYGKMRRAKLGIRNMSVIGAQQDEAYSVPEGINDGAYIVEVVEGSAAESAGIKIGDIITSYNGREIYLSHNLKYYLYYDTPTIGDVVTLDVYRDGETIQLEITLQE